MNFFFFRYMRIGSAWTCRILVLSFLGGARSCCTTLFLLAGRAGCTGLAAAFVGSVRGVLNGFIGRANEGFSSWDVIITTNLLQNWNSWLNLLGSSHLAISLLTLSFEPSSA